MEREHLNDVLTRVRTWPAEAQEELAEIAREIEGELGGEGYRATPEELRGIERGMRDAEQGKFASDAEVEAVFAKYRR